MVRRIRSHSDARRNWKIHRFGRAHRIEILADECNLPVGCADKNHVVLSINAPGRFDDSLHLDLANCACRILDWVNCEIEEPEAVGWSALLDDFTVAAAAVEPYGPSHSNLDGSLPS